MAQLRKENDLVILPMGQFTPDKKVNIVPLSLLEAREDRLIQLLLEKLWLVVVQWIDARPLIRAADRDKDKLQRLIQIEIREYLDELRSGTHETDWSAVHAEWSDVFVFIVSLLHAQALQPDFNRVRAGLDGQAAKDGVYELMMEVAGNVDPHNFLKAIEFLLTHWVAVLIRSEVYLDPQSTLDQVMDKDNNNHPRPFYQTQGVPPELWPQAYSHRNSCFRLIRLALKLAGQSRLQGLQISDYDQFIDLIMNYQDSTANQAELARLLSIKYQLPLRQLTHGQVGLNEVNTVIPTIPHLGELSLNQTLPVQVIGNKV